MSACVKMRKNATALTARPLPVAKREARLAALVAAGKVSAKRAALIDFREPSPQARAFAETLKGKARDFLAKKRRAAA